jgi:hypothetical protein
MFVNDPHPIPPFISLMNLFIIDHPERMKEREK